jgi:V-type H+-transporting ATPase subunit a
MSLPLDISTCWSIITRSGERVGVLKDNCIYAIGVDPTWYLSSNQLTFTNGFKMKMSVIFGIAQMSLGIFMKAFNSLYFKRYIDFFFEFIPQIILIWVLFGFMCLLIIVKWLTDWTGRTDRAPSIIGIMIAMFLGQGAVDEDENDAILGSASTQQTVSIICLLLAFVCVPTMLLVKPLYLRYQMGKHVRHNSIGNRYDPLDDEDKKGGAMAINDVPDGVKEEEQKEEMLKVSKNIDIDEIIKLEGGDDEEHNFGEIFIHSLIETIEFVLGTVSNTASYLRLWALSLAHGQLADVFFDKLLNELALKGSQFYMLFILFPVFFTFTLFVLLCMDSMECFLHTLRLHWVEFQNKFFKGNGYLFTPFSFEKDLKLVK